MNAITAQRILRESLSDNRITVVDSDNPEFSSFSVMLSPDDVESMNAGYDPPIILWETDGQFGFSYSVDDMTVGMSYYEEFKYTYPTMKGAVSQLARFLFEDKLDIILNDIWVEENIEKNF